MELDDLNNFIFIVLWKDKLYPNDNWKVYASCNQPILFPTLKEAEEFAEKISFRQHTRIIKYILNKKDINGELL